MFSLPNIAEYFLISLAMAALCCLCTFKLLGGLQQLGYDGKKYARWLTKKGNMAWSRLALLGFLAALSSAVLAVCFAFTGKAAAYISLFPFPLFFGLYFYADKRALKVPLVPTNRVKHIYLAEYVLFLLAGAAIVLAVNAAAHYSGIGIVRDLRYVPLALMPVLLPLLVRAANFFDSLYENPKNARYVAKAKQKLAESKAVRIGITGSFAKTSVKNILAAMLSEKHTVLATPASYNTPLGIAKFINGTDLDGCEYFIAEMGARHVGDIEELCKLVEPDHCILTGICGQHLETFLSLENVKRAKGEILTGTKEGGFAVFGEDENVRSLAENCEGLVKVFAGEGGEVCAKNVRTSPDGIDFDLMFGILREKAHCKLLGAHNARNIAAAAAMAWKLGATREDIVAAIGKLEFVPHRLQKLDGEGVTILDDSYNSNIEGAKAAIDVLCDFGGTKFVVTPGLVEMGILEESANAALGEKLVAADRVILVGATLAGELKSGYLKAGGDAEKLTLVPTLDKAKEILAAELKTGDTVLFLNDLPDIY